jgi:murein DD-endopeptidase MepM/ murein hydrolase activator NlpD
MTNPVKNLKWAKYPLGDVTQWMSENPKLYAHMGLAGHNGIDVVRPHGEHMFAVENCIVASTKEEPDGHGRNVRLISTAKDENGNHRDWVYAHLDTIAVKEGQEVKEGQYICTMGNTGFVVSGNTPFWGHNPYAGTHLHFGVRLLQPVKRGGWAYPGMTTKWKVVDADNGYKGRFDPLKYFLDPKLTSTKVIRIASLKQDKQLYQFGELLKKIGL